MKEEIDVKGKGRMVTYCVSVEALDKAQGVDE